MMAIINAEFDERLNSIRLRLLRGKTWRYLRYLHLRDAISRIVNDIESICVIGAGHGFAELALAVEFKNIRFVLTDVMAPGYPNYHTTMKLAWDWQIDNIAFSVYDVLKPPNKKFDLVCSTEVLEHIPNPVLAAKHMRDASCGYVYCLVPYSDVRTNNDIVRRKYVFDRAGHYYYGFDADNLTSLFGQPMMVEGAYWFDAGMKLRSVLNDMSLEEIGLKYDELIGLAERDIRNAVPTDLKEAAAIKILSRHDSFVPKLPSMPRKFDTKTGQFV